MRNLSTLGLVMVIQGPLSPLLSFWLCLFVTAAYVSWCSLCHGYGITASLEILVFVLLMQDFHTCFLSQYVLKCCFVVVHICMCVVHILPFLFLTFQLMNISVKYRQAYAFIERILDYTTLVGYSLISRLHIAWYTLIFPVSPLCPAP